MAKTLGTPWQKLGHEVPASELEGVDLYWRASNYLSVGQIYLRSNPLMRPDFVDEKTGEVRDFGRPDVKHRLVGHWGTTPGINFLFGHVNRLIADHNQNAIFLMGPGHGGPAGTAQSLLDGTYREIRPDITNDEAGRRSSSASSPIPVASEPLCARDARFHPRGRRARLHAQPRLRCRYGQPEPAGRGPWWATASPRPVRSRPLGSPTSS